MVKRCCWGTCNSDTRYPERCENVSFIPFPKPTTNLDKCLRWIKACGRPADQLNVNKINRNSYVCSKHFIDNQPSEKHPDPYPATGGQLYTSRSRPKKRKLVSGETENTTSDMDTSCEMETSAHFEDMDISYPLNSSSISTQTEESVYSQQDISSLETTIKDLTAEKNVLKERVAALIEQDFVRKSKRSPIKIKRQPDEVKKFCPELASKSVIPKMFEYYTGLTYVRFLMLLNFLFPNKCENPVVYNEKRKEVKAMRIADQLFLVLCRLRNGLHIKDLAFRFEIKQQSASLVFTSVIRYMYLKLGYLSYWTRREIIMENMPAKYN